MNAFHLHQVGRLSLMALFLAIGCGLVADQAVGQSVSFLVDPDTIDGDMDGFITGTEFQPIGSDGVLFSLVPTNNLVGADRFQLSDTTGLRFGGGAGSTLSFDFSVGQDVILESYVITDNFAILGDPSFDILERMATLSIQNTASSAVGDLTTNFNGGPIALSAGTTYTFDVTNTGAGIQSFLGSWNYTTAVPEPSALFLLTCVSVAPALRRRRR